MHTFLTSSTLRSGLRYLDRVLVTFLLCFVFVGSWGQVATGYTWSQASGTYTAVGAAGSNALFSDNWDDNQTTVTLPFTFTFDEVAYTQVTISSNGFLVFGNTLNANNTGEAYVSTSDASGLYLSGTGTDNGVAGFNADLDEQSFATVTGNRTSGSTSITSVSSTANLRVGMRLSGTGIPTNAVITNISGSTVTLSVAATSGTNASTTLTPIANVVAVTTGSSPNRVFVIQYTRVTRFGNTDDASFQIRLNEGGGNLANQTIQTVYGTCTGSNNNNNDAVQVGIRSTTSDFNSRTTTTDWTATTAGAANTDRCRFRNTIAPPSGRTYTWTPGFCSGAVTAGTISGTSPICTGTGTTLTLSGMSTAAYGISTAWFYSTANGGPYTTSAGTGNSIATGNLSATRYYVATTTCSNGPTSATTSQFVVVVNPTPTASNAGPDQTICISTVSTVLAANSPTNGTGAWSIVAGSPNTSTAQLSSTTSPTATFTPTTSGVYTLTWTISNSPCTASSNDVVITVRALPTTATVGGTQTICAGSTTAALGGNTPGSGTGQWSVVSGGTGTFSNSTSGSSTFTHTGGTGPVVLRWTISNSPCTASTADVNINITPATTASAAGPDQTICISGVSTVLAANAPAQGTGAWSILAGSPNTSTAQLSSTTSPTATFTPTTSGTYTLRWTISNSPCTATTDDVVITVRALPTTATVGGTQTICTGSTTAALGGNTPGSGTGQWSVVSGGTGTFSNSTSGSSTFTHTGGTGPVVLRWTISNSPCAASTSDVTINITPATTTANAGPDQTICLSNTSTTLAANTPAQGTGAWSILAGSPNTITSQLSSTASASATFTPTTTGTYTLRWTISNSPCVASTNDVVITVNPFASSVSQTFNSSSNFNVPPGVTQITVQAWGGGGAGGGSTNAGGIQSRGGAGGGGGAFVSKVLTVTPGSTLSISVGAAVTGTSGTSGSSGNPSTIIGFESLVYAAPGSGGAGNTAGGTPTGGAGGTVAASQGDTKTAGTNGGNGTTGFSYASGAGGAGANGGGAGGAAITGFGNTSAGATGTAPGGGGSGGLTYSNGGSTSGGVGAAGRVIITYTPVASVSASSATICNGVSTTLTATGGGTYLWSPGGATTASINVSPASSTTYSVTVTNTCPAYLTQAVTVNPKPTATATGGGTVCSTAPLPSVTFTFTGTAPYNFTYNPGGVSVTGHNSNTYTITNAPAGTYQVTTLTDANCTGTSFGSTATVVVTPAVNWYADTDGDGFGSGSATLACSAPNVGDVTNNTDQCPTDAAKQVPGQCGCGNTDTDTDNDGTADCNDLCPNDANKVAPGQCGCGVADTDSDSDGTANCNDACPNDANKIAPGVCGCGASDVATTYFADADGDGFGDPNSSISGFTCITPNGYVANSSDLCPADVNKQAPGQCGCGVADTDTDNDGTADCNDGCPNDANKTAPGICGCGVSDTDTDGDGTADCNDGCPTDANKTSPGICGCGVADTDTDGDGTADCNDGCPADANKTAPGICGCGVADTDSDSDGTANCVDGCPNDPNKIAPGACGCGVADDDSDDDGESDCEDGCPNDPLKTDPGQCGCGVPDTDSDLDGTVDCNDECPNDPNKIVTGECGCGVSDVDTDGDLTADCSDNCPNDPNKVNPGTCGCGNVETDTDGDSYADCVDGCPADANKIAPGACGCGVADADNDGDGTLNCNDGCPNDANKIAPGVCGCGTADTDTDGDNVADCNDNCPLVQGQVGSACNDGNANTINDVLTNTCQCAGTSVTNLAALELTTDNDAASTSWDIIPLAGGPALCNGGGYANSSNQTMNCNLPDGCYRLRVFDANMDGLCCMNGMGGYVLRTAGGQRIIDAAGAGIFSNTAEVALGFCVPIGGDHLTPSRCDRENYLPSDFIQATPNAAVQAQFNVGTQSDDGYQFWIFNPNGGYSRRVLITHATNNYLFPAGADRCSYLKLNSLTSSQIPHNMLVNVRVRSMVNGVYSEFGSACRLKIDLTNQCPTTQLLNDPSNSHHSCGLVNVPLNGSRTLYAAAVSGATNYQFEFSHPGFLRKITSPGSNLLLTQWYTMPLQYNSTYNVRVRVSFDNGANYCPFSSTCTMSTAAAPPSQGNQNAMEGGSESMDLAVWPNPNHGEVVTLKLAGFGDDNEQEMTITVTDLFGKQVYAERTVLQGDMLNTTLDMQGYAAGIYLVNVNTTDHVWTKRVIVQ